MVNAMINISDQANQILNIVKAKYNLKDKSKAIDYIALEYGARILEPELKPEYIEKLATLDKQKGIEFKNITELKKVIEG